MPAETHIKIFIGSSAELKEEREKCVLLIHQLNKAHRHLRLEPVEWEYDMVSGSVPGHQNIQAVINPKLQECALAIFIFYSRLGQYTLEEFELATRENKKLFAFFKRGFSPKKETLTAYADLLDFKEGLNDTVLHVEYNDVTEFERHLFPNLNLYFSENYPVADVRPSQNVTTLLRLLADKEEEIKQLKHHPMQPTASVNQQELNQLITERDTLKNELLQTKEIQQQQAKEKEALEQQLSLQIEQDTLKAKALEEVEKGNYNEAEKYLKESAKESISETAATFYELAKIKKLQLQYAEAFQFYELAVKIDAGNSSYRNEAGVMADDLGFYDKAIEYYEEALTMDKKYYGEEHQNIAIHYNNLGLTYNSKGDYDIAIQCFEKALLIDKKYHGEEHPKIAIRYNNLGLTYDSKGDYDKAIEYYNKALLIDKKYHGEEHPMIAIRYNNLGAAYSNKNEYNKAIAYYVIALSISKRCHQEEHPHTATLYNNLGELYRSKREHEKAIHYYKQSLAILERSLPANHPYIRICGENLRLSQDALKKQ